MTGADPGFFKRGCTRLLLASIPINNIVFCFLQNTSCIRKPQVISGEEGGGGTPCTLPLDPPMYELFTFGLCQYAGSTLFLRLQSRNNFTVFIRFSTFVTTPSSSLKIIFFLDHQFNFKICCQSCEVIFPPKTLQKQKTYDCLEYKVLTTTPQSLNSNG